MIAELVAINGYQNHILTSNITAINEAWYHIMLDEKRHYTIALDLLRKYDPVEYKYFITSHELNMETDLQNTQNINPGQGKHSSGEKSPALSSHADKIAIYDKPLILNNVRADIKGELEAIILYEDEIADIPQKDIRVELQKIIDDEKEHTEHLTQVLLHFDPDPYK